MAEPPMARTVCRQRLPRTGNDGKWNGYRSEQPAMLHLTEKSP